MNHDELHKSVENLEEEIRHLGGTDAAVKERLLHLVQDVERHLDNPDDAEHKESLTERLPHLIEQFEVEHPRVTGILNRVMIALSDIGI